MLGINTIRETVETAARTILIKASQAGVAVPREPDTSHPLRDTDDEETDLNDQTVLNRTEDITEQVSRTVYPAFSLDRGEGCEIHEHAYWDLQTYLGLRDNLAVNEGARSFVHESSRERTPFGHAHRDHIRDLSVERIREMYQEAVSRLLDQATETEQFHRMGTVAIDTTEADPFTGDRTGHEDEIIGTKEGNDEYAYQWATVQLVGNAIPLVLDARPVRKGDNRKEIVEDLLDTAGEHVYIDKVLMDREFDSQHVLEAVAERGLRYLVPKRMQTSEKAQARRLLRRNEDRYVTSRKLHLGNDEWHQTTLIYSRKEDSEHTDTVGQKFSQPTCVENRSCDGISARAANQSSRTSVRQYDHRQYAVFMTNDHLNSIFEYSGRWDIESGYKSIKRFMAATPSKDFVLRFFYFAFACLLYSIWRTVDLLVQVELTGEYERAPLVTADNTLTLLKKQTGIG
jgi:IS4 transposase